MTRTGRDEAPADEYFAGYRLADELRRHARANPDRAALTADGRTRTYRDIDRRTDQVAQALIAAGTAPGGRVAVLDKNSAAVLEVLIGSAKAGAVTVPLNWRLAAAELVGVLRDAGASTLFVHAEFSGLLPALLPELPGLRTVVGTGSAYEEWIAAHDPVDPAHDGPADEPVLQLYTSGTTGVPKGVLGTHRNLAATSRVGDSWGLDGDSVFLCAMPMFHIGGLSCAIISLFHGAHSVLVRDVVPADLLDVMERHRVTHTFLVPTVIGMLTELPGVAERDLSALRSLVYGASPITPALLRRALEVFRRPLVQVYGLTETHGAITQLDAADHDPGGPREHLLRSAGRPYPWVELRTVEPTTGRPTAAGVPGEILVRSPGVTPGYHGRPAESAAAVDGDGWFHTGDVGHVDAEGFLTISDRVKDMIITGGENVYPVEVEAVLAEHPAVAQVAVIGVPDPRWGEAVRAVVVLRPGGTADPGEILRFAKERLAGYKCPKVVEVVASLPTGPTGKVLKRELREARYAGATA